MSCCVVQFCSLSNITRNIRVMRICNFQCGFLFPQFSTRHVWKVFFCSQSHSQIFTQLSDTTPLSASWVEGVVGRCGSVIAAPRWKKLRSVVEVLALLGVRVHSPTVSMRFSFLFPPGANVAESVGGIAARGTHRSAARRGKKLVFV